MTKKITRSTVNELQYSAPEFPKSGFPLSYRRYSSFALGRLHVAGFHWTMPGDKISGKTSGECTFHRIVTPIVSPVNAMQYNFYLPIRPLDRSFMKGITPTKLNAMSANWSMPTVTTKYLVDQVLRALFGVTYNATIPTAPDDNDPYASMLFEIADMVWIISANPSYDLNSLFGGISTLTAQSTLDKFLYDPNVGIVSTIIKNLTTSGTRLTNMADALYCRDALLDIAESITAKLGSADAPLSGSILGSDFVSDLLSAILTPFVGRYSYFGEFKYNYLRPFDLYRLTHGLISYSTDDYATFLGSFDDTPQNEYPLRAIYAIWYERFRNVDLEPVSSTLPDWQDWSSTSIFDMSAGGNLCYLLYRIRPWEDDMFISSQVDDLSRHVYAPVHASSEADKVAWHKLPIDNSDTNSIYFSPFDGGSKPELYKLSYLDQLTGSLTSISCPVPTNVNDVLSALDQSFSQVYGLDLNTLRQSQMLEKYLKRNYVFGDEYQDRMLAHYNSRVSDMRINKPEILSMSMDGYDMSQEVSNVSTNETKVGDRTATATVQVNGTEFNTFAEEFGLVISIVCFMPRSMYDGITPQLLMNKQIHLPLPEFASNNEEFGRKIEIAGSGLAAVGNSNDDDNRFIFARYPAYHAWRSRVDEVGGEFLDELQDCTFRRFFGMFSDDTTPKLNYFFIHCRPNLNMFANNVLYDMQLYGDLVNECFVERVLPTPVEVI